MFRVGPYLFKFAETDDELDQVHRLNYRTFVREIPQHRDPGTGRLVDKFHAKNRYLIAVRGGAVVGMLSAHDQPPFSVSDRLPDPDVIRRPGVRPLEVRLLAVEPAERNSRVMPGLIWALRGYAQEHGHTHFVISGVVEQRGLYEHLGFEPLGPAVGAGRAAFVPMWLPVGRLEETMGRAMRLWERRLAEPDRGTGRGGDRETETPEPAAGTGTTFSLSPVSPSPPLRVCLLPGPVALAPAVAAAFAEPPEYHRGEEFAAVFRRVRARLSGLAGGKPAAVFVGSGTLANEAVAATLAAGPARNNGLVLVTGEFGERLLNQARRWGLNPRALRWDWGRAWNLDDVRAELRATPPGGWVWGVHHETSTGVLNDLPGLVAAAREAGQRVCADCVSSLGTVPVDLAGVYLASGASGKALGSYAGLAVVFGDPADLAHLPAEAVPSYLDVRATLEAAGPRFTVPSPLVRALDVALEAFATPDRLRQVCELGRHLRTRLRELGYAPLAADAVANPAVVTFAPHPPETAAGFVRRCERLGFQVAGHSGYLADRGLVQIALMGAVGRAEIGALCDRLADDRA